MHVRRAQYFRYVRLRNTSGVCSLCSTLPVCPQCATLPVCSMCATLPICSMCAMLPVCPLCATLLIYSLCAILPVWPHCATLPVCPQCETLPVYVRSVTVLPFILFLSLVNNSHLVQSHALTPTSDAVHCRDGLLSATALHSAVTTTYVTFARSRELFSPCDVRRSSFRTDKTASLLVRRKDRVINAAFAF